MKANIQKIKNCKFIINLIYKIRNTANKVINKYQANKKIFNNYKKLNNKKLIINNNKYKRIIHKINTNKKMIFFKKIKSYIDQIKI